MATHERMYMITNCGLRSDNWAKGVMPLRLEDQPILDNHNPNTLTNQRIGSEVYSRDCLKRAGQIFIGFMGKLIREVACTGVGLDDIQTATQES